MTAFGGPPVVPGVYYVDAEVCVVLSWVKAMIDRPRILSATTLLRSRTSMSSAHTRYGTRSGGSAPGRLASEARTLTKYGHVKQHAEATATALKGV